MYLVAKKKKETISASVNEKWMDKTNLGDSYTMNNTKLKMNKLQPSIDGNIMLKEKNT